MKIDGKTQLAGLIGADTSGSLSPHIHNYLAAELSIDMVYTCFNVWPSDLAAAIKGAFVLGVAGLNITAPHKIAVMPHAASLEKCAVGTVAVNLLKRTSEGYVGYNTDISGILGALDYYNMSNVKSVSILGNGGAARAARVALQQLGCNNVTILHRESLDGHSGDLLINATSASSDELAAISSPCQLEKFGSVFDMNYPKNNPWLESARKAGARPFDGKAMLVFQAVKTFEILWGKSVPKSITTDILSILLKEKS